MLPRRYYDVEEVYRRLMDSGRREWDSDPAAAHRHFLEFMAAHDFIPGSRALDIGCGGGYASRFLASRNLDVYGMDYATTAVRMARQSLESRDRALFLVADATKPLPFQKDVFSLAVDNHVLHCIVQEEQRLNLLKEIWSVLQPGGLLFSANMTAEGRLDYTGLGIDPETRIDRYFTRYWAFADELQQEYVEAGFDIDLFELENDVLGDNQPACGLEAIVYARKSSSTRQERMDAKPAEQT